MLPSSAWYNIDIELIFCHSINILLPIQPYFLVLKKNLSKNNLNAQSDLSVA